MLELYSTGNDTVIDNLVPLIDEIAGREESSLKELKKFTGADGQ